MTHGLQQIDDHTLAGLAAGLRSGRFSPPFTALQFGQYFNSPMAKAAADRAQELAEGGFTPIAMAKTFELVLEDRGHREAPAGAIDLVTSGPEAPGISNRDTAVVVREMFRHAESSVLVVGYAIYQGRHVFEALAERMQQNPALQVRFCLNVARSDTDTSRSEVILSRFATRFKETQWPPGAPLPEVYYDPRSVADQEPVRSSLHAKCIVVDTRQVFISSANFTEAGQRRNIEVGLRIDSAPLAEQLAEHFARLRKHGILRRLI